MTEQNQTNDIAPGGPPELLNAADDEASSSDKASNTDDESEEEVQQEERDEETRTSAPRQLCEIRPKRPSPADSLEKYNYKVAVESWDQIGSLTSEVASSMLSQLAESMSEQMKEENQAAKRRKMVHHHVSVVKPIHDCQTEPTLVSSDEETSSVVEPAPIPRSLSLKIDRMARMSKYMMQIDRYHRLLRDEMVAIRDADP